MDQSPPRHLKPPARIKPSKGTLQQAQALPTTVLASLPKTNTTEAARITEFYMVEGWVFNQGQPVSQSSSGSFTKDQISEWLKEPKPATTEGATPAAGLRLLCCEQRDSMKLPFDKDTFEAIQDAMGLPKTNSYLHMAKSGACGKYLHPSGCPTFVYHRSNNNGTISTVLKYDPTTAITTGYSLVGTRISLENLGTKIRQQFPEFAHPLLIPTVLIELTATDLMRELYHINRMLTLSEATTQSGDWEIQDTLVNVNGATAAVAPATTPPEASAEKDNSGFDPSATEVQEVPSYWANISEEMAAYADHHRLARILGWLSCRFAFMNAAVQCSISMAEFTLQELELIDGYSKPSQRRLLKGIMNGAGLKLRIQLLDSNLRHMAVFGAIEPRMQSQQTVLFNLINIGMARDSKEVSEATKRDSSAMKIIAALTTLFLPATFLATFFAMPILDWNALSMGDVMTNRFWLYWAIAVPMTVVVMGIVGLYGLVLDREKRKAVADARMSAGLKEA